MRVILIGQGAEQIRQMVTEAGLEIVESDPQACICFGGDGTLLGAERDYPGLPKIPIRKYMIRDGKPDPDPRKSLRRVAAGNQHTNHLPKLQAITAGRRFLALNDIIIHNADIVSAVRYRVEVDEVEFFGEIVGDGLVASTPFGSSAYYRSITNSVIHVGIGLAFNNCTEPVNHLVLSPESRIRISVTRGPAVLAADNNPCQVPLEEDDVVEISVSEEQAVIWEIENLLCMQTGMTEDSNRRLRWLHPRTRRNQQSGDHSRS